MSIKISAFFGTLAILIAIISATGSHRVADLHPSAVAGFRTGRGIYDITGPAAEGK